MSEIKELHEQAMEFADQAFISKRQREPGLAKELTEKAFALESRAANLLSGNTEIEPTRSILYRSAASLAIECGKLGEAKGLIETALSGNPPVEIKNELVSLLKKSDKTLTKVRGHSPLGHFGFPGDHIPGRRTDYLYNQIRTASLQGRSNINTPFSNRNLELISMLRDEGEIIGFRLLKTRANKNVIRVSLRNTPKDKQDSANRTRGGRRMFKYSGDPAKEHNDSDAQHHTSSFGSPNLKDSFVRKKSRAE